MNYYFAEIWIRKHGSEKQTAYFHNSDVILANNAQQAFATFQAIAETVAREHDAVGQVRNFTIV